MTRKKILVLAAVAVGIAAIVVANIRLSYEASVEVEAEELEWGEITEKVSGPGVIYAESSVKISSSVMGRITKLHVKEGDVVTRGDLLIEIDASQYRARLHQAEAAYGAALARHQLADAKHRDALSDHDRKVRLSERNLISERDLELAKSTLDVSRAELHAAEEASKEAKALLEAAEDEVAKTVISTPISGTVTSLNVEEGEIVITGTMNNPGTVIMTISSLDTMEVRAEIDETDVAKVAVGQTTEIEGDAFPDTVLAGVVSVVGSSSSAARTGLSRPDERSTFEVRVRIEDRLPGLRPGMTTTVDITTATRDSVPCVPLQSLVLRETGDDENQEREGVFIVEEGRSVFVPIRTGISDDNNIEVLDPLPEDADVITGPFIVLRDLEDSTKVKVTRAEE